MKQPNEAGFLTNVALVHDQNNKVIKTGLPITPQVAPSGLWSTPHDLAKLTLEIQNALRNKNNTVISHQIAKQITKTTALKDAPGVWSYGWQKTFGINNTDWFAAGGSNTGVGGWIYVTMENGNGFVYLANGEKPNRFPVNGAARNKIFELFDWGKDIPESEIQVIPENLKNAIIGKHDDFLFKLPTFNVEIVERNNRLFIKSPFFDDVR